MFPSIPDFCFFVTFFVAVAEAILIKYGGGTQFQRHSTRDIKIYYPGWLGLHVTQKVHWISEQTMPDRNWL